MRDFALDEQLKTILARDDCAKWILVDVKHGAAPAFDEQGRMCFRFADDGDAELFQARLLP